MQPKHAFHNLLGILLFLPFFAQAQTTYTRTITVQYNSTASDTTVQATKLKYNKDFAYSLTLDDGKIDHYLIAHALLNGKQVANTFWTGGYDYGSGTNDIVPDGYNFTDGCGNPIKFRLGLAINARYIGFNASYLNWQQIQEVYNTEWDIFNHSYNHEVNPLAPWNTDINPPLSLDQAVEGNSEAIENHIGFYPRHFVIPSNSKTYLCDFGLSEPCPNLNTNGMIAVYNQNYTWNGPTINASSPFENGFFNITRNSLPQHATPSLQQVISGVDNTAQASGPYNKLWYNEYSHTVRKNTNQVPGITQLGYPYFKQLMDHIESNYGMSGADNIWVAGLQEVSEYLYTRDHATITTSASDSTLTITISFSDAQPDQRHLALSVLVPAENIQNISIDGSGTASFNLSTGLVNVELLPGDSTINNCPTNIPNFTSIGQQDGHGYYLSNNPASWTNASDLAAAEGGYMASITSQSENDFIQAGISGIAFLGLTDYQEEGALSWDSGDSISFTNYSFDCDWCYPNTEGRDFGIMMSWDGKWSFTHQYAQYPFVMEKTCETPVNQLTITCPNDTTMATNLNEISITWQPPTATSTCNIAEISQIGGQVPGSTFTEGIYEIDYKATDVCGQAKSCQFSITVIYNPSNTNCGDITNYQKLGNFNGHTYYLSDNEYSWVDAQTQASSQNGKIVAITSQAENDFLKEFISGPTIIGLSDINDEGFPSWSNGESLDYTNYTSCEWCGFNTQDNDFGVMLHWDGTWAFQSQWVEFPYILEKACDVIAQPACPTEIAGFTSIASFNNHNYFISNDIAPWNIAKSLAENAGGYLATMNTAKENSLIQSNIGNDLVFIGLNDANTSGSPEWVNGDSVSLDLTYDNTADNNYALLNFWSGTWQMVNQSIAKKFILEIDCTQETPTPPFQTIAPSNIVHSLYPNPADDFVTVRLTLATRSNINFAIFNTNGQLLFEEKNTFDKGASEHLLDIQSLEAGIYFIRATNNKRDQFIRFAKAK